MEDRNFDKMAEKFEERIYGSFKGEMRLELLREDLEFLREGKALRVWDAGCGGGRMALWFAEAGHDITGCDISSKLLRQAKERFEKAGFSSAKLHHKSIQETADILPQQELVLFHAVIEWLADPMGVLKLLSGKLTQGGYLSLMFFNHHALIYRNAMRGSWRIRFLLEEGWKGKGKNLTPPHPQKPEELIRWLESRGFEIVKHTGIRVFYDYMQDDAHNGTDLNEIKELERKYCREETFRDMGRYVHLLARKR